MRVSDVDLDNLLITLDGKGRKQRIVPVSFALRKALHRYIADFNLKQDSLLFATQEGAPVRRMTALRSIKLLCEHLGFVPPARCTHSGILSPSSICVAAVPCSISKRYWATVRSK